MNPKKVLLINFLFLILMVLAIVGGTVVSVLEIHFVIKIVVIIVAVAISLFAFIKTSKMNKKLIAETKQEEVIEEKEEVQSNYAHEHIRCPKCHKPFDGNICFYCGFTSVNKEKIEELESL